MAPTDLAELLSEAARAVPGRLAVVESTGRSTTWQELDDQVSRVAAALGEHGVVAGRRVLICLPNRTEFVVAHLAVLRAQAVSVPVNPRATAEELARMIADSGSRILIADAATVDAVRDAAARVTRALDGGEEGLEADLLSRAHRPHLVVVDADPVGDETAWSTLLEAAPADVPALPDPEKLAALLYTSGTSGRPRAAMLTHRALLANLEQTAAVEPRFIGPDDVVLGVLPLFHVYGLNAVLGSVLRHRARLVLADHFDPEDTLDLIDDEAVTVVPVAPPVFAHWLPLEDLAVRLHTVRMVISGSAPLSAEVIERFTELTGIAVHQGYGLTEAAPVVTSTLRSHPEAIGSVGAALEGIELRVLDDDGQPVEGEDPGQIQIRGANLFSGYWPDGADGPDEDGWWSTGDVGILDAAGDLSLVDRLKELIIVSGFNVYPHEVEDVVKAVDGVTGCAVIGVPDETIGEAVVAYVVAPDRDPGEVADAVRERCTRLLARFKQPSRIEVVDVLPHTPTGKVQKGRLRGLERRRELGLIE